MHINRLEINNFMRVQTFAVDAHGKHVVIQGENGSGKSSVVLALWDVLTGSNSKERPEPVHQGADKALIRLEVGNYEIEKHIAQDGKARLVVKDADGKKISNPQKFLDGLIGAYSLDPVAFIWRRPQDQLDDVLKVCGVTPPVDQVEEITGEKWPAAPNENGDQYMERLSADEVGAYYLRRRELHRQVETCRGAVDKQEALCADLGVGDPGAARPVAEIMAELEKVEAQQKAFTDAETKIRDLKTEEAQLKQTWNEVCSEKSRIAKEMEELTQKLDRLKLANVEVEKRMNKGMQVLGDIAEEIEAATSHLPDNMQPRIDALRAEIKASNAQHSETVKRQQASERLEQLRLEYQASKDKHAKVDQQLESLRQLRKELLEGLDLGVDGLAVGQGELRLHGVSFKQASMAQKLRVACAVAMKSNAELKLLRIDDGEHLDSESKAFLLKLATEQGWQVIMTCVADNAELKVEIVDGEVAPAAESKPTKRLPKGRLFDTAKEASAL